MLLLRDRALLALDLVLDIAFHAGRGGEVTGAAEVAERLAAARRGIEPVLQALVRAGVDTLELSTDGDLVDAIMRFTELRKRRGQSSGAAGKGQRKLPDHLKAAA